MYDPLWWELKQQYPGYDVKQFNNNYWIINYSYDVLGGWFRTVIQIGTEADPESDSVTQFEHRLYF